MGIYHIESLEKKYNEKILGILKESPIVSKSLKLYFDRSPDFFRLAEIKYQPHFYYGFFRNEELKGYGMIGYHKAYVNGNPETVFHLKDFYLSEDARGKGFGLRMAEKLFRKTYDKSVLGYAVVMAGNAEPLKYVGHSNPAFPFLPYSRIINQLDVRSMMLVFPVARSGEFKIRRAESGDIPSIVSILNEEHKGRLFGNIYDEASFHEYLKDRPELSIDNYYLAVDKRGIPCGVCAAWDCTSFKQTRILNYGNRYIPAILAHKILTFFFNSQSLPGPGEAFREVIVTDYGTRERDPRIMNALLRVVYNDYRRLGFHNLIWGSSSDDPILAASKGFFVQRIVSNIVLISTNPRLVEKGAVKENLPFIDIPCL